MLSELRKDPVINRWVITMDDKQFTPQKESMLPANLPEKDPACPFCEGNEDKAGKLLYESKDRAGKWRIRVVPNNNPYLKVETQLKRKGVSMYDTISGTGANEVIIESSRHDMDLDGFEKEHVRDLFKAYKDRILDLKNDTRLEYILIYRNRGFKAGAQNLHPHSELMAMPVVPKRVQEEMEAASEYHKFKQRCVYCDLIENEVSEKERIVKETEHFVAIVPFASMTPFEMWIIPRRHQAHYHCIDDRQTADLAYIMKECISRLNRALNRSSYNFMIHTSPVKDPEHRHYHWHIEILPRIKSIAGFEWSSGFYINHTPPEEAAGYLRKL
ncbi:MAG: galactose-1-phosphate uridylyltransferase [Spirochaetia bacterium]|nr:galactose-1-phosphate uridylyltransferase [Spirochaetia bacterium]